MNNNQLHSPTIVEAAQELYWLESAASSVLNFAGSVDIPGQPLLTENEKDPNYDPQCEDFEPITTGLAEHHILLLSELDKVLDFIAWKHFDDQAAGKRIKQETHDRTMVFMPPGSAKSTYSSVVTPAYAMGRLKGLKVMLTSYASSIAKKQGRKGRAICKSNAFQRIFDTELSKESSAADEWALTNGSEYMAGGILSGLTGNRAHLGIIDDPVRGRKDADSELIRKGTLEAYEDDFLTRLLPDSAIFMILTRWHELDLAGQLLPDNWNGESGKILCKDGKEWNVICLPAICDSQDDLLNRDIGEPLWPEWFSLDHFAQFKVNLRTWHCLFQQQPTPSEGSFYKRSMFIKRWSTLPSQLEYFSAGDFALTEDGGDFTEVGIFGVDPSRNIYVCDWFTGQVSSATWISELFALHKKWQFNWLAAEPGQIKRATESTIRDNMRIKSQYFGLKYIGGGSSKEANAGTFQNLQDSGRVYWPEVGHGSTPDHVKLVDITNRVIEQLIKAFGGRYDDAIDATSCFGLKITEAWEAWEESSPEPEQKVINVQGPTLTMDDLFDDDIWN